MTERIAASEVLQRFPTLGYLSGKAEEQLVTDKRDGKRKREFVLTEGSGMFGLENKVDALNWKGIFNHVIGSVRNETLSQKNSQIQLNMRGRNLQNSDSTEIQ